ncbi:MAG TPA: MarR family transcriptional regulator [Gemmatimonadaceae bacterium]
MTTRSRTGSPRTTSTAQKAMVSLLLAAGHLRRELNVACARHDITSDQYNVLRILRGAGEGGLPRYEIASRMIERAPDVTRLLDRLEARGLVDRARSSEDRRLSLTRITEAGHALLERLDPEIVAVHEHFARALSHAERLALTRVCNRLLE